MILTSTRAYRLGAKIIIALHVNSRYRIHYVTVVESEIILHLTMIVLFVRIVAKIARVKVLHYV